MVDLPGVWEGEGLQGTRVAALAVDGRGGETPGTSYDKKVGR